MKKSDALSAKPPRKTELVAGTCPNCGADNRGSYCPACGQQAGPLRLSILAAARENASELLGLDGRIWRTFATLLFKPGRLTRAFIEGRRVRYLRPFRVYLTASVLCFLLLAVVDPVGQAFSGASFEYDLLPDSLAVSAYEAQLDSLIADADSLGLGLGIAIPGIELNLNTDSTNREPGVQPAEAIRESVDVDSLIVFGSDRPRAVQVERWRVQRHLLERLPRDSLIRPNILASAAYDLVPDTSGIESIGPQLLRGSASIKAMQDAQPGPERMAAISRFVQQSVRRIPTVLFVILPIFALLLKLLYVRRDWYYSEHLVFALHAHAVVFFAFALVLGIQAVHAPTAVGMLPMIAVVLPVHFLLAQKHIYRQTWGRTVTKAVLLGTAYSFVLVLGLAGALVLAATLG